MNTNQLKKFAKEARIKLITQIEVKLDFVLTQDTAELRGKSNELGQLRSKLSELGREQLIETVAYTWFNRMMALRFMDANGYNTPKVVTPLPGMSNPEILQNALAGNIEEELKLDRQRLNDLIDGRTSSSDAQTEAFKLLLVASCNKWHTAMPFMFERISDYTELLLPDDLLSDFSIVSDIRNGMSDEDCSQEELIGWLYQFYISDKKDDVFEGLKKNIKITAENIPAATQLFTPRWIVRYMVENTLGKLWLTFKPESALRNHMPYFIEVPEGNSPAPLPEGINSITDITFLDPCQGSGHVLVYAFELLSKIYEEEGYNTNEIPSLILEHNLYGIDIDERAAQLAAFALTMKARSYYSRFLRNPIQPNVIALENVNEQIIRQAIKLPLSVDGKLIYEHRDLTLYNLTQADNLGALIQINPTELNALQIQNGSIWQSQEHKLKEQAEFLSKQYHCVVTNPPYMNSRSMNSSLRSYVDNSFAMGNTDLFSSFLIRCNRYCLDEGFYSSINQHSWMFLSSFEALRKNIVESVNIDSLLHLGTRTFPEIGGAVVQSVAFAFQKTIERNPGSYFKLIDYNSTVLKEDNFLRAIAGDFKDITFKFLQENFKKIQGDPIAYWVSDKIINAFSNPKTVEDFAKARIGMMTTDNNKFLRNWNEVSTSSIHFNCETIEESVKSNKKWFPYNKGGNFRKWYGNNFLIVNWKNQGEEIRSNGMTSFRGKDFYFQEGLTWSFINNDKFGVRYKPKGYLFDIQGSSSFPNDKNLLLVCSYLCSNVSNELLNILNPTLSYQANNINALPFKSADQISSNILIEIEKLTKQCIEISKIDWDSRETSFDFKFNELIKRNISKVEAAVIDYNSFWKSKFYELHQNEEKINEFFIESFDLKSELKHNVPLGEVTILQEELKIINGELLFDINSIFLQLISYSVGCVFGRYSIDKSGLILGNQAETIQDFLNQVASPTFMPDEDNIIPVLDDEWFNDDIVGRLKVFLKAAFGEEYFEENLRYIEETIDRDIRKYLVKDFYNDHVKRYKKRPIYWMFSSPKGHFKSLIYMHRYQPDLCSKMLNDYLQPFISKLEAAKQTNTLLALREDVTAREKTIALKEVDRLELMIRDCKDYERTLFTIATQKITINLDDGVKVNYLKFKEVLIPIKGLEKEED